MKYGPIIFDPTSEEAKKLIGKTVLAADFYTAIADTSIRDTARLVEICDDDCNPFKVMKDGYEYAYNFIREVMDEKPKYRPYKDTDEMVADFKKRFCSHITISQYVMPLIWVTFPNGPKEIVSAFGKNTVWLNGDCFMLDYIFETGYTYLDGTPVGKET